jgi:hypothetical protein
VCKRSGVARESAAGHEREGERAGLGCISGNTNGVTAKSAVEGGKAGWTVITAAETDRRGPRQKGGLAGARADHCRSTHRSGDASEAGDEGTEAGTTLCAVRQGASQTEGQTEGQPNRK